MRYAAGDVMQPMLDRRVPRGIFRNLPVLATLMITAVNLSGCAAIKTIFKAGVWAGVIAAALVIMVVVGLTRAFGRH
jgi:hypothetical protein